MAGKLKALTSDDWSRIFAKGVALHLEPSPAPVADWVDDLLGEAPFERRLEGTAEAIAAEWAELPEPLLAEIVATAQRFAKLVDDNRIAVRLEGIVGNGCTKVHADYVDVRLIRTLAGPGTDYVSNGEDTDQLSSMPTGWIGLFKGRAFPGGEEGGHPPCLHRSPAIAGTGTRRLLLVMDRVRDQSFVSASG
jgi:hypothetical protein